MAVDNDNERPLDSLDAGAARELRERFADLWIRRSGLRTAPPDDAAESLGLRVSPADESDRYTLRATSYYTGGSWWLRDWDGDAATAYEFIDRVADAAATDIKAENRRSGRRIQWD